MNVLQADICALLGYYAASDGNLLKDYHTTPRNIAEGRRSHHIATEACKHSLSANAYISMNFILYHLERNSDNVKIHGSNLGDKLVSCLSR
jgi:hypothetical protein